MEIQKKEILKWIYYIVSTYLIISFLEWSIHKYLMHGNENILKHVPLIGKKLEQVAVNHKKHHKDILMNMHYVDLHLTNGFGWGDTMLFTVLIFFFLKLLTRSRKHTVLVSISLALALVYSFLWNTLHNHMHNTMGTIHITEGVPSLIIPQSVSKKSYLYKKLYTNHALHHLQKGTIKYNFNIIFPFFDYVFFTKKYGKCYDNSEYCKINVDTRCDEEVKGCLENYTVPKKTMYN